MRTKCIDFSKFSSIKIGPVCDVTVVEKGDEIPRNALVIGHANNLLVSPTPPPLMMLGKSFDFIRKEEKKLLIGAATPSGRILSYCKTHDIGGFEFVGKLPGTLGGMLAMNAGLKEYEIFNRLLWVQTTQGCFEKEKITHGYRFAKLPAPVTEAAFAIAGGFDAALQESFKAMRANQPKEPSAGSLFKNPPNDYAGRLIEAVGLKGHRIGQMALSGVHANFLVNLGGGTYEEAMALIHLAKERVFARFGIRLQEEVVTL